MFKQLCVLKDYSMKELQIKNCFPLINSTVAMAGRKIVSHNSHAYPKPKMFFEPRRVSAYNFYINVESELKLELIIS